MKKVALGLFGSAALILVGCGATEDTTETAAPPPALTNESGVDLSIISTRQGHFEDMGSAFRSTSQTFRSSEPDLAVIQSAATLVYEHSLVIGTWFPEGTGPEAGVETEALSTIWEDPAGFADAITRFQAATSTFNELAQAGDLDALPAAFRATGGTCGFCHDTYRLDDD